MIQEFYTVIIAGAGTGIGSFLGWFFTRRYQNATAKEKEAIARSQEIDNEVKLSDYYKGMLDDLGARYEKKFLDMVALFESKEKMLKDEISLLKNKVRMLTTENGQLRRKLKEYESKE